MVMGWTIALRTDSSPAIGTGHVMRCLTLADALRGKGYSCLFVMRPHPGNAGSLVEAAGHGVRYLPASLTQPEADDYATWSGASADEDADATIAALGGAMPEYLLVDHYGIDAQWESRVRKQAERILVIDDLHNRRHDCDLLVDQTLGASSGDYAGLVPSGCTVLAGAHYAMLRPEFAALRDQSLARRSGAPVRRILVALGGADLPNMTGLCLEALVSTGKSDELEIDVVLGASAQHIEAVRRMAADIGPNVTVSVGVSDMAERMAKADLSIGAAGTTTWERACLGLPSVMVVTADNQRFVAASLSKSGAATLVDPAERESLRLAIETLCDDSNALAAMARKASTICDGQGTSRVLAVMEART